MESDTELVVTSPDTGLLSYSCGDVRTWKTHREGVDCEEGRWVDVPDV